MKTQWRHDLINTYGKNAANKLSNVSSWEGEGGPPLGAPPLAAQAATAEAAAAVAEADPGHRRASTCRSTAITKSSSTARW